MKTKHDWVSPIIEYVGIWKNSRAFSSNDVLRKHFHVDSQLRDVKAAAYDLGLARRTAAGLRWIKAEVDRLRENKDDIGSQKNA